MIARLWAVTAWLLVGHAGLAALYWGLLHVPESNAAMLGASAALVLALLVGAAVVEGGAVLRLGTHEGWRRRVWRALACVPALLVAVGLRLALSGLHAWLSARHDAHAGEIDALLIAHVDWTRTAWLHTAIGLALDFLRDVVGTSLAVGALVTGVLGGFSDVLRLRWVGAACSPKRLLLIALAVVGLIWLPWQAASWRPASLPPTAVQVVFAAVKLGVIALVMHLGWAVVLWSATPDRTTPETAPPL